MSESIDDFVHMWEWFATHCEGYSPLYARISAAVAGQPELLRHLRTAPPSAHLPPALLAAVHYLLLEETDHPLAAVYAGRSEADPGPLFVAFWRSHQGPVMDILGVRHIQTNDCGRSALIGPALTWLAAGMTGPFSLVDVGASAGLNLLCDQFRIDYGAHGATGPAESAVRISCQILAGSPPIAATLPPIAERVGIDRSPMDVTDPDDARWLLACVWPDTGRLERTAASIRLAQSDPPRVVAGDANDALPGVLAALPDSSVAVLITTWAFAYLSIEARQEFMELLDQESHRRRIAWISAEGAGTVPTFADRALPDDDRGTSDVLGAIVFDRGERQSHFLAYVQEHGGWIDWRAAPRGRE